MAAPHDFMAWCGIFGSADVAAEASYETDGVAKLDGFPEAFFFAYSVSTSISMSENRTSDGISGQIRPRRVISMIRQAMTKLMAMARSGQRGCAMSFGPGLTAETMRFHAV